MRPTPAPGLAFVRRVTTEENYRGSGIVIPEQARDKLSEMQWEIVACGAPEPCDDEDCERYHECEVATWEICSREPFKDKGLDILRIRFHRCDLAPGDWVLLRKRSAVESPEPELWIVRQDAVIGRFTVTEDA